MQRITITEYDEGGEQVRLGYFDLDEDERGVAPAGCQDRR